METVKQVRRVSQIREDILVVQAVFGPLLSDQTHDYFVRKVPVSRLNIRKEEAGRMYRLCVFPDFSQRWVNEGNIRGRKVQRFAGGK